MVLIHKGLWGELCMVSRREDPAGPTSDFIDMETLLHVSMPALVNQETLHGKRILFACVPGDGHFNPLTGLAKHLQTLGCDVRWYASAYYTEKLKKLDIPHYPFTKALDVPSEKIDEIFPERNAIKGQIEKLKFDMINYFILRSTEYFADIQSIHQQWPIDAIVADCVFSAIPFIQPLLHIPLISIGVLPLIQTSKELAPPGLGVEPSGSWLGRLKQDFMKTMANKVLFRKPNQLLFSLLDQRNIPHTESNVFDVLVNSSTIFLQTGTPGFEYSRSDLGKNIRFLGPLLPYRASDSNRTIWHDDRLNHYRNVILVTQGTVEKDVDKLLVPTLEAFKQTDTLVVATTGGSQTEILRIRYPHENLIIEDFISFDDIMPYAGAFVTNGGFGGVLQAVQYGLPMVVAGIHEGKNEIAARVGYFNYGINLNTEIPKPEQIHKAVAILEENPTYKTNVQRLADEFRAYPVNDLFAGYVAQALTLVAA